MAQFREKSARRTKKDLGAKDLSATRCPKKGRCKSFVMIIYFNTITIKSLIILNVKPLYLALLCSMHNSLFPNTLLVKSNQVKPLFFILYSIYQAIDNDFPVIRYIIVFNQIQYNEEALG